MKRTIIAMSLVLTGLNSNAQNWYDAYENFYVFSNTKIQFINPDLGYTIVNRDSNENQGLYLTTNGGGNWKPIFTYGNQARIAAFKPIMLNDSIVVYQYRDSDPLEVSFDQGKTWDTFSLPMDHPYRIFHHHKNDLFISEAKEKITYLTSDFGENWKKVADHTFIQSSGMLHFLNDSVAYTLGFNNDGEAYLKTTNQGKSWTKTLHHPPRLYDYTQFKTHFIAPDTAVGFSDKSKYIYWSYNEGQSWDSIAHGIDFNNYIADVKFADKDTGYLITDAFRLWKTCNGGKKWKEIHYFDCAQQYIGLIDARNLYFYSTANNQGCISKTRNGGGDFCTSVATDFISETPFLHIYPQPSKGQLNIDWNLSFVPEQLLLYNANGQLLKQIQAPKQGTFQFNNLPSGVYLLKLSNSQEVRSQRVVFE